MDDVGGTDDALRTLAASGGDGEGLDVALKEWRAGPLTLNPSPLTFL